MLGDLPPSCIKELSDTNEVICVDTNTKNRRIKLEYFPRKTFQISDMERFIKPDTHKPSLKLKKRVMIWDVFGFFQSSFVVALKQYGLVGSLDQIEEMKSKRAIFANTSEEIKKYCFEECRLLVELMNKVKEGTNALGFNMVRWHGAGAIASTGLQLHKVRDHYSYPSLAFNKYVLSSYFGGRIQACMLGQIDHKIYSHDIVSAYPSTIYNLPSLKDAEEFFDDSPMFDDTLPELSPISYHVEWDIPNKTGDFSNIKLGPFPWRDRNGQIEYPLTGEGYYWHCELKTALKYYKDFIKIKSCMGMTIKNQERPFNFIREYFNLRAKYKAEKNHTQLVIKLFLNSCYGKTAQGIGYKGRKPPFQNYIYAGLITAHTRSKLFDLAMQAPESVIAFCTDGLYSLKRHDCTEGKNLGDWEYDEYDDFFIIKPGFYQAHSGVGILSKIRGFRKTEVDWNLLRNEWREMRTMGGVTCNITQFYGMKNDKSLVKWRHWENTTKNIYFKPLHGFALGDDNIPGTVERTYYPRRSECSTPYKFTDEYLELNDRLEDENSSLGMSNIL